MTGTTDDPRVVILPYVQSARWFGGKGRAARVTNLRRLGEVPGAADGGPRCAIDLVTVEYDDAAGGHDLYQLPLAFYPDEQPHLAHALIGVWADEDFGTSHVYDAVHDRAAMACWLRCFVDGCEGAVTFHRVPGHELDLEAHSTLFSGEQSNSSVRFGEDSLMKVFRRVTPGPNPDISIHEVLTAAGSDHVAALYGWVEADDDGDPLHLAMLQQFLRTASDGWELALASVRNLFAEADLHADEVGGDFAGESARLGTALAETHESLREHFPTERWSTARVGALADAMQRRLDEALAVVPGLEAHADPIRATFDAVRHLGEIDVQRIHGDLHLGQTLRTVKGWKLVDFEGEPAKPLAERVLPDSRWRDVAGMLRSFDYAPRVVARTADSDAGTEQREFRAGEWSARNRQAFLEAYSPGALDEVEGTLLAAYVTDKAVYEAVYETRNRPTWVDIPLAAFERLST